MSNSQADRLAEQLRKLEAHSWRMVELWNQYQGKGWPDKEGDLFIKLRDETVPELRASILAAIAKQQASPEALEHRPGCDALGGYGHGVGPCDCGATPPSAPQEPAVAQAVPMVVTDEMVTAYLTANDAYWKRTDELPQQNPGKWRNGTPREATRVSLEAALSQGTSQAAATGGVQISDERIREIFMANGFTIKEGQSDLKPYVYAAARAILAEAGIAQEKT